MSRLLIILMAIAPGCATFSVNGLDIYDKQSDIGAATHQELRLLVQESLSGIDHRLVSGWKIVFTSTWLGKENEEGDLEFAAGLTVPNKKTIYLKVHNCFAHSSIFHAVGHVMLYEKLGDEDIDHNDVYFWGRVHSTQTMFIHRYCPPYYDPQSITPPTKMVKRYE